MDTTIFTNWTNHDFTGQWGGKETLIKARTSIFLPDFMAFHFAKHLVNFELLKKGFQVNSPMRQELLDKCLQPLIQEAVEAAPLPPPPPLAPVAPVIKAKRVVKKVKKVKEKDFEGK